jgi:multidrug efflux pump subunit AcrB
MIGIVRLALRRPYTFVVMAVLMLIFGTASALRTPTRHLPEHQFPRHQRDFQLHGSAC